MRFTASVRESSPPNGRHGRHRPCRREQVCTTEYSTNATARCTTPKVTPPCGRALLGDYASLDLDGMVSPADGFGNSRECRFTQRTAFERDCDRMNSFTISDANGRETKQPRGA